MLTGYNNWVQSNVRQYLNSDKPAGTYYIPQNIFDNPSNDMNRNGFMNGFKQENFLKNVVSVTREIPRNKVCDCGGFDHATDKFFLPTSTQVGQTSTQSRRNII